MSSTFDIFAETWTGEGWALVGEPVFSKPWDCMRPPEWLELSGKALLVTLFTGRLAYLSGLDHTGIEAIARPRGLPDDLSSVLKSWAEIKIQVGVAHEPSWLRASEILSFDWHARSILHRGHVSDRLAHHFDGEHPEAPFPFDVWPKGDYPVVTYRDEIDEVRGALGDEKDYLISAWPRPGTVEVYWSESHWEFLGQPDDFLTSLRALGPADEVRLVFWREV